MKPQEFIDFIVYLTPGFLALEIFRAYYPAKSVGEFKQVAWSIIYGASIFVTLQWIDSHWLRGRLLAKSDAFPALSFLLSLIAAGVIVGFVRVGLRRLRVAMAAKFQFLSGLRIDPGSIWLQINQDPSLEWAVFFLDDGSIYLGVISAYRYDPDADWQDFLVEEAYRVDEQLNRIYRIQKLYLNTKNVKRIEYVAGS